MEDFPYKIYCAKCGEFIMYYAREPVVGESIESSMTRLPDEKPPTPFSPMPRCKCDRALTWQVNWTSEYDPT